MRARFAQPSRIRSLAPRPGHQAPRGLAHRGPSPRQGWSSACCWDTPSVSARSNRQSLQLQPHNCRSSCLPASPFRSAPTTLFWRSRPTGPESSSWEREAHDVSCIRDPSPPPLLSRLQAQMEPMHPSSHLMANGSRSSPARCYSEWRRPGGARQRSTGRPVKEWGEERPGFLTRR